MFKIEIDSAAFQREFSDIEKRQLPFALQQTTNQVAFETRNKWKDLMRSQFDRPTPYTVNSVFYDKADYKKGKLFADVFVRDETSGGRGGASIAARTEVTTGTPPAKYLQWQERGGLRRQKAFEKKLARIPGTAQYYSGGKAVLDAHGNVSRGLIQKVLSQLRVSERLSGSTSNETDALKARRLKSQRRKGGGGRYFVLAKNRGKLRKGVVYERINDLSISDEGNARATSHVRTVLSPSFSPPRYRARLGAIALANKFIARRFSVVFPQQLARAVESRKR